MLDARRMEVYTAAFDAGMNPLMPISAMVITGNEFADILNGGTVCFIGNGSDKCHEVITHPNAIFIPGITPLASFLAEPAFEKLGMNQTEDVAYFEPFYLKDFVAIPSKIKGLR